MPGGEPTCYSSRMIRRATLALVLAALGCGGRHSWLPAAPYGTTYAYASQGFQSSDTTVVAGTAGGLPAYGAAFAFRTPQGVHWDEHAKSPFAQSAPIDGVRFNEHLQGQGARLLPTSGTAAGTTSPGGHR